MHGMRPLLMAQNTMKTTEDHDGGNASLLAGVGKNEITTRRAAALIRDPLYAKALVLADGSKEIVIITMDVVAIGGICDVSDAFLPSLRRRIEAELGIPGNRVMVNASHTHPPGEIVCGEEELIERTFDAVRQARGSLVRVVIGVGSGSESRISMNRNLSLKDGSHWTIRHANPCPPDEVMADIGPSDPEVGVLRIDREDGAPFAVVYNFACHPLFGDAIGSVTANYPGVASRIIEEHWGHETMAFFLQGAAGDVIDVEFKDFHRARDVEPMGILLGLEVLRVLKRVSPGSSTMEMISESLELPRKDDFCDRMASLRKEKEELFESLRFTSLNFADFLSLYHQQTLNANFPSGYAYHYLREAKQGDEKRAQMDRLNRANIEKYLSNIQAMERMARICDDLATLRRHQIINKESGSQTITAEIQGIRIGSAVILTAPLEVLTQVALNVKAASPHRYTFIAAFSNGYMHYGPPSTDYDKGGYEVTECFLAPEWQALFESKAQEILQRL